MESESGFRSCTEKHTKCVGSIYHKNKVPTEMFEKANGEYYTTCSDCRTYIAARKNKRKNKDKKILAENDYESEFLECNYLHTNCVGSLYSKDKVPREMFQKSNGGYYKICSDCRKYNAVKKNKCSEKKRNTDKIKKELIQKDSELEFSFCPYNGHSNVVKSFHSKDLVPISFFRIEQNNPKSELFVNCLDCREYMKISMSKCINNINSLAEDKGMYVCRNCNKLIDHCDRAINLDGTLGTQCIPCKEYGKQLRDKNKQYYINIKLEFVEEHQCSCYDCKFLFLKPNENSLVVRKIPTYKKCGDENRYALIDDKEMYVKDIIKLYYDDLEVSIIDLDHLPEKDQRERGLLLPNEIYVPKKLNVSAASSKSSIKLESLKCQHLCILCHVKATIEREKGESVKTGLIKSKHDYVSKLKEEGCSSCKFSDINTPKFFDMDHLDITTKKTTLSKMCIDPDYSLDDIIKECTKCRVLCKHCHRIHTNKQRKQGLFLPKIKDISL